MCMSARAALTEGGGPTSWRFASRPRRTASICKEGPGASYVEVQHTEPTEIKSNFTSCRQPVLPRHLFIRDSELLLLLCTPDAAYPLSRKTLPVVPQHVLSSVWVFTILPHQNYMHA
ncbi:hypothetical protein C2845_PM16G15290 [Panicum miliaceum]|uniref:Uncharacterized protein n=1 Tax=Panicum miliaceum TaxID=4540 RepID=A0A3L6PY94_PANMI|nr:hypothetical protein C2845_PM16G15290 [Panicum miliaceum]